MLIRKASPEDAQRIGEVDARSFLSSGWGEAHSLAQDEQLQHERRTEARQYCLDHPDWVYVAIEDDDIVGFATIEYDGEQCSGRIQNNAVLDEYRNRGISTQLVQRAVAELGRLGARRVGVHTTHVSAARRVYEKAGFELAHHEGESYTYEMNLENQEHRQGYNSIGQ